MRNWKIGSDISNDWSTCSLPITSTMLVKGEPILLTVIGPNAFKLLRSLVTTENLEDKSYSDLVETMMKRHKPKPSEIMQRYKFSAGSGSRESPVRSFVAVESYSQALLLWDIPGYYSMLLD